MRREGGFTLIESMVTLVVISAGLLALGSFTIGVLRSDATARARIVATHVAEQMLEEWSATGDLDTTFGFSVPAAPTNSSSTNTQTGSYPASDINITYALTASVTRMVADLPNGVRNGTGTPTSAMLDGATTTPVEKKVTVSWTRDGRTHSVYLTHVTVMQ